MNREVISFLSFFVHHFLGRKKRTRLETRPASQYTSNILSNLQCLKFHFPHQEIRSFSVPFFSFTEKSWFFGKILDA